MYFLIKLNDNIPKSKTLFFNIHPNLEFIYYDIEKVKFFICEFNKINEYVKMIKKENICISNSSTE